MEAERTPNNSRNSDVNAIKIKLESIKTKQPNVYKLWKILINKKESALMKTIIECDEMLNNVDSVNNELSILDLQTLSILKQNYKTICRA
jgi:hypothetical protein